MEQPAQTPPAPPVAPVPAQEMPEVSKGGNIVNINSCNSPASGIVKAEMNSKHVNGLMDTGAAVCVMDLGTLNQLVPSPKLLPTTRTLMDASRTKMDILGKFFLDVKLSGSRKTVKQKFYILNSQSSKNVILGVDFMKKLGKVTFDFEKGVIQVQDRSLKTVCIDKTVSRIDGKVTLPARSETIVQVRCSTQASMVTGDFVPANAFRIRGIYAANCRVTPNFSGVFAIKVLNTNSHSVTIHNRQVCGQLRPSSVPMLEEINLKEEDSEKVQQVDQVEEKNVAFGSQLTAFQRKELLDTVNKHAKLFTGDPKKPTESNLVTHTIPTGDHLPVKHKRTTVPHAWEEEIDKQSSEMLRNGIIRPSTSPWNSPVLLTRKKDGSTRFVLDFRSLNDVTRKDTYPLPKIQDIIDKMEGFSVLDDVGCG